MGARIRSLLGRLVAAIVGTLVALFGPVIALASWLAMAALTGEFTDVGANISLDAVTGRATQAARTMYLALLTAAPGDTTTIAGLSELTTAGYARQAFAWAAPALSGGVPTTANSALTTFGPFTADPPNVTHAALVSSSSGTTGDLVATWALDVAKDAAINESIQVAAGAATLAND